MVDKTQARDAASVTDAEIHSAFSGNFYANNTNGNGLSGPFYHDAKIKWNFLYNNIDWELVYHFNDDKYNIRPFVGLKVAFLNQNIDTQWQTPYDNVFKLPISTFSIATENITNNFWGVGPFLVIC